MPSSNEPIAAQKKNPDELIADISRLMAEAEAMLSESTSFHAEEQAEIFRERKQALENRWDTACAAAKARLAAAARCADGFIRTHPYESAALALGLGLLLGAGCSRSRR
jgi:ElaB/YqjD/DUF883 family membrane-anchored ribosome-binding protein